MTVDTLGGALVLDRWQPVSGLVFAPQLGLALARRGGAVAGDDATVATETLDSLELPLLLRGELTLGGRAFYGIGGIYGRAHLRARLTRLSGMVEPGRAPGAGEVGWLVGGGFELTSVLGGQLFVELRFQRGQWARSSAAWSIERGGPAVRSSGQPETMSLLLGYGLAATPGESLASWQTDPSLALKTGFVTTGAGSSETYGPGFSFGLAFSPARLGGRVAAVPQVELSFTQRHARRLESGAIGPPGPPVTSSSSSRSLDVESLDLSLLVRGEVDVGGRAVFALGGVYGSALVSARRTDGEQTMEVTGASGSLDAGWLMGAGIELGSLWGSRPSVELRYQRSLRDQLVPGVADAPLGSFSVLVGLAYGRDDAPESGTSATARPVVIPARLGSGGQTEPETRAPPPRRIRSVVVARPGDRFLDTMEPRRVARARRGPFGYAVTYAIAGEGELTFFWPRRHIELHGRTPGYRLRWHPLREGRLRYPTAVTRRSLPKVHGSIVRLEEQYTKQADGGIAAAAAFAKVVGLATGVAQAGGGVRVTLRASTSRPRPEPAPERESPPGHPRVRPRPRPPAAPPIRRQPLRQYGAGLVQFVLVRWVNDSQASARPRHQSESAEELEFPMSSPRPLCGR